MSTEPYAIADDQVRSAFQRWKNLEEEKARIGDDLKELFAEQKAFGHDTKAMRAAFRLKVKMDEADPTDAEHEALVDTYLAALDAPRASRASRAYARENTEQFDANPRLIKQVVDGIQSEAGKAALLTAINIMIDREEAEELEASDGSPSVSSSLATREPEGSVVSNPEMDRATEGSFETGSEAAENARKAITAQGSTSPEDGSVSHAGAGESPATDCEIDPSEDREEGHSDDGNAAANAGGDHVDGGAKRANRDENGEGAASTLPSPPKHRLRPNCQHPENCASGTRDHCWSCRRAMQKSEEAA